VGGSFLRGSGWGGEWNSPQGCHRMIPPQGFDEGAIPSGAPRGRGGPFLWNATREFLLRGSTVGGGGNFKGVIDRFFSWRCLRELCSFFNGATRDPASGVSNVDFLHGGSFLRDATEGFFPRGRHRGPFLKGATWGF
jgi:hypothetical protein